MKKCLIALATILFAVCGAQAQNHNHNHRHGGNWHGGNWQAGGGNHWNTHRQWSGARHWNNHNRFYRGGRWFGYGGFGWHDRVWWINCGYPVFVIDGCYYYYANGCYYPAFGYDPSCSYFISE